VLLLLANTGKVGRGMGSESSGRNKDFIQKELIPEIQQAYGNDSVTTKTYGKAVRYTFKLPDAEDNLTRLDTLVAAVQHISDNLLPIKAVGVRCTWHRRPYCSLLMKCTATGYGPVFATSAFALMYHPTVQALVYTYLDCGGASSLHL
jgi:hypothetical protein